MPSRRKPQPPTRLIQKWPLATAVTLGSAVRAKGILLEVRANLPKEAKKLVNVEAGALTLHVPEDSADHYAGVAALVSSLLNGIEALPIIPREIEDILTITAAERHRWLKDGRLQSAGTRTVKLRGRARKITFHVFDPRHVEDILDRDLTTLWREEDAETAADNRRRAAWKAARTRAAKSGRSAASVSTVQEEPLSRLKGWEISISMACCADDQADHKSRPCRLSSIVIAALSPLRRISVFAEKRMSGSRS